MKISPGGLADLKAVCVSTGKKPLSF